MSKRDDFSKETQQRVAERAAFICSNPECRDWTVGPHSDPKKSLKTGEAAHIRAASKGGPRYDEHQASEERKSIQNAVWLCTKCSTVIDKDEERHPPALLIEWKQKHEDWLRNGGIVPTLTISIATLNGLTLPEKPVAMNLKELEDVREHRLRVENKCDAPVLMIDAYLQLPEAVIGTLDKNVPPGIDAKMRPDHSEIVAFGSGIVTRTRPPLPTKSHLFLADRVPPKQVIEIALYTSNKPLEDRGMTMDSGMWADLATEEYLLQYIEGTFQFEYRGATITKKFFAPIQFDKETRTMSIVEIREDYGTWKVVKMGVFA